MDKQPLRGQLEELDAELKRTESLDDGEREVLRRLEGDIREVLAREGDQPQKYEGLGERLREAVAQLEASHPTVTMRMRQVIDQLSFMGI
jgi:hypothetical protein